MRFTLSGVAAAAATLTPAPTALLAVSLLTLALLPASASAAPVIAVAPPIPAGGEVSVAPDAAVDPNGTVTVAFTRDMGGGEIGIWAVRRAPGGMWSAPLQISAKATPGEATLDQHPKVVALPDGGAVFAYMHDVLDKAGLRSRTMRPDGTLEDQVVHTGAQLQSHMLVRGPRGDVALLWTELVSGERHALQQVRPADGFLAGASGWAPVQGTSDHDGGTDPVGLSLAGAFADNGALLVGYLQDTLVTGGYQTRLHVRVRHANSTQSQDPPISSFTVDPDEDAAGVAMAAVGGTAQVAWSQAPAADGAASRTVQVRPIKFDGGIVALGSVASVAAESASIDVKEVFVAADGTQEFFWETTFGAQRALRTRRRSSDGTTSTPVETLSDPDWMVDSSPGIVRAGASTLVAFVEHRFAPNERRLRATFREDGAAAFAPQSTIPEDAGAELAAVGDAAGNGTFIGRRGTTLVPILADNDGGPDLSPLSAPAGGGMGDALNFSGSATDWSGPPALSWAFSDGAMSSGGAAAHAFATAGPASATLTATDAVGQTSAATAPVTIAAPPGPTGPATGVDVRPDSDIVGLKARVARRKLKTIRGTASDDRGVARVDVAIVRCRFTRPKATQCRPQSFRRASGTVSWRLKLKRRPAKARYIVYSRATDNTGKRETSFSAADRNRKVLVVR